MGRIKISGTQFKNVIVEICSENPMRVREYAICRNEDKSEVDDSQQRAQRIVDCLASFQEGGAVERLLNHIIESRDFTCKKCKPLIAELEALLIIEREEKNAEG